MSIPLINPYTVGPPVIDTNFYGRDKLLSQVGRSLQSTNVVLLQGQRRIGKTSFLRQLARFLLNEQLESKELPQRIPILFDIQRYVQDTLPQFQLHLAEMIIRSTKQLRNSLSEVPTLSDFEADSTLFQDKWLPGVHEQLRNQELVILVDEFDNFDEQTAPHAIQSLIPFLGQLVSGESWLKWVFALGRLAGKVSLEYDPILRSGEEFRLTFFLLEEIQELIVEPAAGILNYCPDAIEYIYSLTNGQPHLTQAICSKVFEYLIDEDSKIVTVESVAAVVSQTLEAYGSAIASIVSVPPVEEKVLIAIAKLTSSEVCTTRNQVINLLVDNGVRLNRDDLSNAIKSLLEWELLKGDSESLQIAVELVQHWLLKNRLLEPSQQENLDIQYTLAQSRFNFAEKALQAGQYDLAIKDYKESLGHISSNVQALRGLAEAYRLSCDFLNRVETLKKLYLYDQNNLNELTEALEKYAQECENKGDFSSAVQQYNSLLSFHNCDRWQKRKLHSLIHQFEEKVIELEDSLVAYRKEEIDPTELDNSIFLNELEYLNDLENFEDNSTREALNEISSSLVRKIDQNSLGDVHTSELEEDYTNTIRQEAIQRQRIAKNLTNIKAKLKAQKRLRLIKLNQLAAELQALELQIKDILKEGVTCSDSIMNSFCSLEYTSWRLSKRVEIELAKSQNNLKTAASILQELDKAGEKLDEEDEELLLSALLSRFERVGNSFKLIFVFISIAIYLVFLSWLVKDWYEQAFIALITGGLIIAALIIPFILWGLTEGMFILLRRGLLKILKQFKLRILDLANSN